MLRFRQRSTLRAIALAGLLLLPGTPYVVSAESARDNLLSLATLEPERRSETEEARSRIGGAPPNVDEMRTLGQSPPLSGAYPPYPRNHVLDANPQSDLGDLPANHDFETPGYTVGTPPANHDLEAAAQAVGTPPANHDFETGDFSGWTTSGTMTIDSDAEHGYYARLTGSNANIISDAFTVDPDAHAFVFEGGHLTTSGGATIVVHALTGPSYGTATQLGYFSCSACNTWKTYSLDATPYRGQSLKLKFTRSSGAIGIDAVRMAVLFPDVEVSGPVSRGEETGNSYARLTGTNATLITAPITVESSAQYGALDAMGLSTSSDQYYVYVLSGQDYSVETQVLYQSSIPNEWRTVRFFLGPWEGQSIKLKVRRQYGQVGIDNLGIQWVDAPGWTVTADTRIEEESGNRYISTNGTLTSEPFTLAEDAQQLLVSYRDGSTAGIFDIKLLGGVDYSQELVNVRVWAEAGGWHTQRVGVQEYAGQSVRLVLDQYWGRLHFDEVGVGEALLPGWQLSGTHPFLTGEDTQGTYVTPIKNDVFLWSSPISTGIIDTQGVDQRYYSVTYAFGNVTGSIFRVWWYDAATGQNWVVHQDASNVATAPRTKYFWLADFMGEDGYFRVQVPREGTFYAIADNIARQQLSEPFSEQVGQQIDTSTGSFGYQSRDLATAGVMPLQFVRYYAGHSTHYGTLGYRWTHSYDTRLVVLDNDDAGVILGSGREIFFDWYYVINDPPNRYIPVDPRNRETLEKNGDGTYTFTTVDNLRYHFDAAGVLLTISDLNGNTVTLARDGQGRVTSVTNTAGRTLTLSYDGSGRLASVTDPVGAVLSYGYDANGDLTTVTDPENEVWSYAYDRHRLASVTAPDSTVIFSNSFDDWHRVTTQTLAGNPTIELAYDTPGQGATQVTDPEGNTATYYFDRFQRTTEKVDPLGRVYTTEYDAVGNLQKRINPAGEAWTFAYDADGNTISETDPLGNPTSYTYNPLRQPLTVTDARGNVWTNVYDSLGNLTTSTDPKGNATTYTYNANGNLTSVTDPLNHLTSYTYDAASNRTSTTDARGKTSQWTYDAAGRLLTETNPLGQTTTYTRNLFGWIKKIRDPLGHEYSFTYDVWGNLVTHTDPLGNVTTWGYDERADVVSKTDPLGKVTTYAYDDNHNMISMTDPLNRTTTWTYDDANRLTSTTDPLNQTTSYTYDDADRLVTLTDPLNRTTAFAYDDAGRLTSKTLPSGGVWSWTYDPNGNVLTETNPRNDTTTFVYDDLNRLTSMTDALSGVVGFGYDAVGNRTSLTDPRSNTWSYTYDAVGNVLSETDPPARALSTDCCHHGAAAQRCESE